MAKCIHCGVYHNGKNESNLPCRCMKCDLAIKAINQLLFAILQLYDRKVTISLSNIKIKKINKH